MSLDSRSGSHPENGRILIEEQFKIRTCRPHAILFEAECVSELLYKWIQCHVAIKPSVCFFDPEARPPESRWWYSKMEARVALAVVVTMAMVFATTQASDPELTTDFFVAAGTNKATLTEDYFTSVVFRAAPVVVAPAKIAVKRITSDTFPVLTGLGVSATMIKYLPGGINPPHTHPRGTELLFVMEGTLTVGLVDTTNKFFTKVLQAGDVFVFPKGLVHYQINLGNKPVTVFVSFSSSNPGTVSLPATLFGSGIPDNVHTAAFKVDNYVVNKLQAPFGM